MSAKRIKWALLVVFVLALALPVVNLAVGLPGDVKLGAATGEDAAFASASAVLARKCANCHTDRGEIPFYASFPLAKGMVQRDIQKGTDYLNLVAALSAAPTDPVNESVLAKLEYSIQHDTMPPHQYMMLHWNGGLGSDEAVAVMEWIATTRRQHFASANAPEELKSQALQPLPDPPVLDPKKVALGKKLYHDGRLSKDDTVSCASCHDLKKGGVDREQFSKGVGGSMGDINAPTVYNASLQLAQFWDGRAADLQAQADGPPNNPIEMASNWPEIISKLDQDEELKAEFLAAYPEGFSGESITAAIAEFEKTLVTPGSAFDRYLLGDKNALSAEAKAGHEAFVARQCATCHVGAALGGQSYDRMGREGDYFADRGKIGKADMGRFNLTKDETDRHHFKVPLLRNIAQTAPYFHDGTVETLADATSLMGRYQIGLELSEPEVKQIVAFLESLTGQYDGALLN